MADTTTARKPSPRPRPVPDDLPVNAAERPTLHLVPVPDDATLQPETETGLDANSEPVSAGQDLAPGAWNVRIAHLIAGLRSFREASRAYWTPPAGFVDRPASLQQLAEYARTAPWTAQQTGIVRTAGVGYYRFVGYPKTVSKRYGEWVWQRPGRLAAHLAVIKLIALTGPGSWAVDHLVYPVAQFAGRLFL